MKINNEPGKYIHAATWISDDFDVVTRCSVNFGKRSQTKHTHLSKEDTSRRDAWGQNAEDERRTKIYNEPKKKR